MIQMTCYLTEHELDEIMINYKDLTNQDYRQGSIAFPVPVTKQAFLTG